MNGREIGWCLTDNRTFKVNRVELIDGDNVVREPSVARTKETKMRLDLSQPELCTIRDALLDTLETVEETLIEMERGNEDADEIVNQRAYRQELADLIAKVDQALEDK